MWDHDTPLDQTTIYIPCQNQDQSLDLNEKQIIGS